ncbi:MAG: anti-sigma factor antagonist [Candidatus Sumerlaeia bacterium]|nr:anti-sigma factor antagonist [Candidatus Sumerlaeia bacterium]
MNIRIFQSRGNMLVQLGGRFVLDECERIKSAIIPRITREVSQINLDLAQVEFIDSAGLGVLVQLKTTGNKNRSRLALVGPSKGVSDILMVSKLDSIFDIITGAEASSLVSALARPEYQVEEGGGGDAFSTSAVPRTPAMPVAPAPRSASESSENLSPKDQVDQLCKLAVDHMRQGDYDSASEAYIKALEIDPEYLPAHNNLAIVYEKKPAWQERAIKQWERVLELSESRGDAKHIERAKKHLQNLSRLSS